MLHNEVTLIGRLRNRGLRVKVGNQNSLKLVLAVHNDENYDLDSNNIVVNYITDNYKMFYVMIGESFVVNGHLDTKCGQRIICDDIFLLKY